MLRKLLVTVIATGAMTVPLAGVAVADPPTDPVKPENPSGYGEIVNFGAREDHDIHPGPGNVVGGVRSDVASSGTGGLKDFVKEVREQGGSTPNPPGQN